MSTLIKKNWTPAVRSIPTVYSGVRFRSRLEATWAAFFDNLKLKWDYEPLDMGGWIPDFILWTKNQEFLIEVKPIVSIRDLWWDKEDSESVVSKVGKFQSHFEVILIGCRPFDCEITNTRLDENYEVQISNDHAIVIGNSIVNSRMIGNRFVMSCACGEFFLSKWMEKNRHCECHKRTDNQCELPESVSSRINLFWADAKNKTQWKPL